MITRNHMRSLGWIAVLAICVGLFAALSLRVHAIKSEVLLAERKIVALEKQTLLLETEFETRASQRQLAGWNAVEFGFEAPRADQYLEGERQLASLGQPLGPGAPTPIRFARAEPSGDGEPQAPIERKMVSPITGEAITLASVDPEQNAGARFADAFGDFLVEASPIRAARAQTGSRDGVNMLASRRYAGDGVGVGE